MGSRDGHSHGSWRVQVSGVQGGVQAAAMRFWPKRDNVTNFLRQARKASFGVTELAVRGPRTTLTGWSAGALITVATAKMDIQRRLYTVEQQK